MDIYRNGSNKKKECQVWFISGTSWAKSPRDLQSVLEVLSSPSWEHHPTLKAVMREQYGKLISDYEVLLNRTKFISSWSNDNSPIWTTAKILEILIIRRTGDLNWFNEPIINIRAYIRLIIKVLFPNNFCWYLTEMENKIKQLLTINKF